MFCICLLTFSYVCTGFSHLVQRTCTTRCHCKQNIGNHTLIWNLQSPALLLYFLKKLEISYFLVIFTFSFSWRWVAAKFQIRIEFPMSESKGMMSKNTDDVRVEGWGWLWKLPEAYLQPENVLHSSPFIIISYKALQDSVSLESRSSTPINVHMLQH